MFAGWMISDSVLRAILQGWLNSVASQPNWAVELFQNQRVPQPGDVIGNYQSATFNGYRAAPLVPAQWGTANVITHVAESVYPFPCEFTANANADPQFVYGYLIADVYGNLILAESFPTPVNMVPRYTLSIQPVVRHGNLPPSCT